MAAVLVLAKRCRGCGPRPGASPGSWAGAGHTTPVTCHVSRGDPAATRHTGINRSETRTLPGSDGVNQLTTQPQLHQNQTLQKKAGINSITVRWASY